MVENAKIKKFECDILGDFQTLCLRKLYMKTHSNTFQTPELSPQFLTIFSTSNPVRSVIKRDPNVGTLVNDFAAKHKNSPIIGQFPESMSDFSSHFSTLLFF